MKIVKIKFEVRKGTELPIASIDYDPENLINEPLVWKSLTPQIIEINRSLVICTIQCGCGTVCAEDNNGVPRVYCVIDVKNKDENMVTATSLTSKDVSYSISPTSRMYSNWYGYDNTDSVISTGYSGNPFSYSKTGTRVTLESGALVRKGIQNLDSSLFRSELVNMNNISTSLTPKQRQAWFVLRFTEIILDIYTFGISDDLVENVKSMLISAGIDLADKLVCTLMSFTDWYVSEMNAESYFNDFT